MMSVCGYKITDGKYCIMNKFYDREYCALHDAVKIASDNFDRRQNEQAMKIAEVQKKYENQIEKCGKKVFVQAWVDAHRVNPEANLFPSDEFVMKDDESQTEDSFEFLRQFNEFRRRVKEMELDFMEKNLPLLSEKVLAATIAVGVQGEDIQPNIIKFIDERIQ